MVSIILWQSETSADDNVSAANLSNDGNIIVLTSECACGESANGSPQNITYHRGQAGACLPELLAECTSEKVLFLDSSMIDLSQGTTNLITTLTKAAETSDWFYAPLQNYSSDAEMNEITIASVIDRISLNLQWPLAAVGMRKEFLQSPALQEARSLKEVLLMSFIEALSQNAKISETESRISFLSDAGQTLTAIEKAQCLRHIIQCCNIEELFPNHAWDQHEHESAAACYHTLAAMFIRLGDLSSATETLSLSDQLEDSPRSLALKGLIALAKGETLGAVANLVSSLQQYEQRKESSAEEHYLSFRPQNLERVNSQLSAGLEALNRRDNAQALGMFASAMFDFDPFYKELGIEQLYQGSTRTQ